MNFSGSKSASYSNVEIFSQLGIAWENKREIFALPNDLNGVGEIEKEWEKKEFEIYFAESFGIGETITYLCTPNRKEGENLRQKPKGFGSSTDTNACR